MREIPNPTRREYLKAAGAASVVGLTGLSGCLGDIGGGGPIPMGSILPITGELGQYGSGMQEAVNLAVGDVNDAGGPLEREISMNNRDSETSADRAVPKYNSLVNEQGIVGLVGPSGSGPTTAIAQSVAEDRVMQVSNAATSPALAEIGYSNGTKYFARTAPNDGQQGIVMGKILDEYVGAETAAFLYVDNPYGKGLADKASGAFSGEVLRSLGYDTKATDYTGTLDSLFQGDPDAIGFVGYPGNGETILKQWDEGGYGGEWVLSEGLNSPEFLKGLQDIVAGMYISSPDPEQTEGARAFQDKIGEATLFAAHSYDALMLQALAMHKAGEASGTAIAKNIRSVSRPGGEKVTVGEFEKAKNLLDDGSNINYEGASSPVDMNESLEPLNQFAILQVQDDASTKTLETIPRKFFQGKL